MKFSFGGTATAPQSSRQPKTAKFPELKHAEVAALYRAARIGGDYFDFFKPVAGKMVFILMDVAGKRERALHVAAAVQDTLHERAPKLLANGEDEPAVTTLAHELNAAVMKAAEGVCCAPALFGIYDESIDTITYINAGHTPGLLRDAHGISELPANGLPFGLFTHSTHDAQFCALTEGAAIILASKGLVESKVGSVEFGLNRLKELLKHTKEDRAISLCREVIEAVEQFELTPQSTTAKLAAAVPGLRPPEPNDVTTVVLMRVASS
jgi:sigma-B regulation protein RsbU (phosphoserine phosphatase)